MYKTNRVTTWIATVAMAISLIAGPVQAADLKNSVRPIVHDVVLSEASGLQGTVVDAQGQPQSGVVVELRHQRAQRKQQVRTDRDGKFDVKVETPGVYHLTTDQGICVCRLWTHDVAPPAARTRLLIVNDARVQRGQRPIREIFHSDPILMAGLVAAAIAIPIAVHKSRGDAPEGS